MRRWMVGPAALLAGMCLPTSALAQGVTEGGGRFIAPEFSIGWVDGSSDSDWTLRRQASVSTAAWHPSGWWLEARSGLRLGPNSDLLLAGGWFLPVPASGTWQAQPGTFAITFHVPSYQWGTVDALFRYRALQGRFDILAGVRWDKKKARLHYSDDTDDAYTLDTYTPFLGCQVNQPMGGGVLSVRVLGSPIVFGEMRYKFWVNPGGYTEYGDFSLNDGSLFEARAQYTHAVGNHWVLGGFAQWNHQWVRSEEAALSGMTTERVSWRVVNETWTLGLTAALNFRTPN